MKAENPIEEVWRARDELLAEDEGVGSTDVGEFEQVEIEPG